MMTRSQTRNAQKNTTEALAIKPSRRVNNKKRQNDDEYVQTTNTTTEISDLQTMIAKYTDLSKNIHCDCGKSVMLSISTATGTLHQPYFHCKDKACKYFRWFEHKYNDYVPDNDMDVLFGYN